MLAVRPNACITSTMRDEIGPLTLEMRCAGEPLRRLRRDDPQIAQARSSWLTGPLGPAADRTVESLR